MKEFFSAICAAALLMTGCGENPQAKPATVKEATQVASALTIQINGKN